MKMQNIEIKAQCNNLKIARQAVVQTGAVFSEVLEQKDTYFPVKNGRMKLREIPGKQSQLIFYSRPDTPGPRTSEYHIYAVDNVGALKELLDKALSVSMIVDKQRKLYRYDEVRIHLDTVTGLGDFIELEGVLKPESDYHTVQSKVDYLLKALNIDDNQLIPYSYSDLLRDQSPD